MSNIKDNQIYFNIKDNLVKVSHKNPITFTEFLEATNIAILTAMLSIVKNAPEEAKVEVKEDLYDKYNAVASSTLNMFAPEIEMRPHLTVDAILEAENAIIKRNSDKLRNQKATS